MSKKRIALLLALMLFTAPYALAQPYQDGVYRDLGTGYNDEVVVTVTVRGGEMTELTAENRRGGEKSEYFVKAEEGLSKAILEKQSIDGVDAVAGATGTSDSILAAMRGILEQMAYTGPTEDGGMATAAPQTTPAEGVPEVTASPADYSMICDTSTQPAACEAASNWGNVTSTALLGVPAAGNTVSNRLSDSSR